jgi:hypothetical protein
MNPCLLCLPYFGADSPAGTLQSVGIGLVCPECKQHTQAAFDELACVPGILSAVIPDGQRNNQPSKPTK